MFFVGWKIWTPPCQELMMAKSFKNNARWNKKASRSRCRWDGETSEVGNWISLVQLAMPFSMRIVWFVVNYFPRLSFDSSKVSFCWAQRGRCKVAGMILGLYWCFSGLQSLSFRSFRHSLTCWVRKEFVRWEKFVFKEIWTDQKWTCLNMPQKVWQGKKMFCVLSSIQLSR